MTVGQPARSAAPANGPAAVMSLHGARGPLRSVSVTEAVLGRVRAACRRRAAWLEHIRRANGFDASRVFLDDLDNPEAESEWCAAAPELAEAHVELDAHTASLEADTESPLARVVRGLALGPAERDVLHTCFALEVDASLAATFALLRGAEPGCVTSSLVGRLFGWRRARLLSEASALCRWRIVKAAEVAAGEEPPLVLDPMITLFIQSRDALDAPLLDAARFVQPKEPLDSWPVKVLARRILAAVEGGTAVRIWVCGPRGSGRRTLAACVCKEIGAPLLAVDTGAIAESDWPAVHLLAQRQAALRGIALAWLGPLAGRARPPAPGICPLELVIGDVDTPVVRTEGAIEEQVTMPRVTLDERRELWRRFVPSSATWAITELEHVAGRYRMTVGDIASVGRHGLVSAKQAGELCRELTRDRLGELGHLIDCPFSRADLTVPKRLEAVLDDFLFEARERAAFWENERARRLFPRGRGLIALMTGSPGTGKTMAAQVIAAELELDLFRIDVAASVSKYIGETAKNLQKIFARAREMNAVLFFDEADALFSKRTDVRDAHDRYANTDTNYLLQLLEDFPGIALLASNKRANIDAAFIRRLRYVMEFQRPDAAERRCIWGRLVTELAGADVEARLGGSLDGVARALDLTGAQIKLAVLTALFAARQSGEPLAVEHLMRGADRELSKIGMSVSADDRRRVMRHGR